MKICLIQSDVNPFRPETRQATEIAKGLVSKGHEVFLTAYNSDLPRGKPISAAGYNNTVNYQLVPLDNFALYTLLRLLRHHVKPDLIHSVGGLTLYPSSICGKILRIPVIHTLDHIHFKLRIGSKYFPLPRIVRFGVLPFVDCVVCTNNYVKNHIQRFWPFLRSIVTFPCGVSDIWMDKNFHGDPESTEVLFWGDATKERGIDVFMKSIPYVLEKFSEASFVFAIRDWLFPQTRRAVYAFARKFHGKIRILRFPYTCHVSKIVADAKVIVLPYRTNPREPPGTLVESLALGKGVVTTDIGGNRELIGRNERGILVEPDNHIQLSEAILTLLINDELREKLGEKGRRLIKDSYDWNKIIGKILKLYDALADKRGIKNFG